MITKTYNLINFICDSCDDVLETDCADLTEARVSLKDFSWKTVRAGGVWEHYCPECQDGD